MTVIILTGVIACVALAMNVAMLAASSLQNYNNAQYVAESALSAFIPPDCRSTDNQVTCAEKRCDKSYGSHSNLVACLKASVVAAAAVANNVASTNSYVANPSHSNDPVFEVPTSYINSTTARLPPVINGVSGTLEFGHCIKRLAPTPGQAPYVCYTLRDNQTFTVSGTPITNKENFINAARVTLRADTGAGAGAMRVIFNIFGVPGVNIRKGAGVSHFDRFRVNAGRNEMYPFQNIEADWLATPASTGGGSLPPGSQAVPFNPSPTPTLQPATPTPTATPTAIPSPTPTPTPG